MDEGDSLIAQAKQMLSTLRRRAPVRKIQEYYGERIAFYCAFCELLSRVFQGPAVVSLAMYLAQLLTGCGFLGWHQPVRVLLDLVYVLVIVGATPMAVQLWERCQTTLAAIWGMREMNKRENRRPGYHGMHRLNPISREEDFYFPPLLPMAEGMDGGSLHGPTAHADRLAVGSCRDHCGHGLSHSRDHAVPGRLGLA